MRSQAMFPRSSSFFGVPREHQALMRELGLSDLRAIFTDGRIIPWRTIPERENCTMDARLGDGRSVRLHIKRYRAARSAKPPGELEADGMMMLKLAKIPTVPLVAWGRLEDGRSFTITEDLAGFSAADKLIESGLAFSKLLEPTADLAARLHAADLHHRDMYLCHFFAKVEDGVELRLIDPARVKHLPGWPFRERWLIKDLAQFWYSTLRLPISDDERLRWLSRYARQVGRGDVDRLRRRVQRKSDWIARHDRRLNQKQPDRNISIPPSSP